VLAACVIPFFLLYAFVAAMPMKSGTAMRNTRRRITPVLTAVGE
jgi:hypothetical protein